MRHFTKTHNDLKWLFPIAKTKKEAEKVFESAENQAKYLADMLLICLELKKKIRTWRLIVL